ncbi:RNA-binding protein [candidate division KSB1 bacterium]|nr:RNA-binding protein [candidate division KSB1 bacterium]
MNIYVGNLPKTIEEETIRELFAAFGEVTDVKLIKEPETGELRGFGFVRMASKSDALKAIRELNGHEIDERTLIVNEARPRNDRPGGYTRGGHGRRNYGRNF